MKVVTWMIFSSVITASFFQNADANDFLKALEETVDEVDMDDELSDDIDLDLVEMFKDPLWSRRRSLRCESRRRASQCFVKPNGCGTAAIQKLIPVPNAKLFKPACDKHDTCYNCGDYRGWSLKECDKRFLADVKHICDCNHQGFFQTVRRLGCKTLAYSYYRLIKIFGKSNYPKPSKSYCSNDCVVPLGSPEQMY